MPARLCIFARAPEAGRVKKRLARAIGDQAALEAHIRLTRETLARLDAVPGFRTELWLAGPAGAEVRSWLMSHAVELHRQQGRGLGARMLGALDRALAAGVPGVVVGTDCPEIDAAYVRLALDRLAGADVVFGPAEDGGYGLVAAAPRSRARLAAVFSNVPWGSQRVLKVSLTRCAAAGLRAGLLPMIWDVDTVTDWRRYLARRGCAD